MHCVTLRLGHTWSIELVATMRNSYNIPQMTQIPLHGGHHFYLTSVYTSYVHIFTIFMLPYEYNCTMSYNYALCGVLKWQSLKQVALNLQQDKIKTTNVIGED